MGMTNTKLLLFGFMSLCNHIFLHMHVPAWSVNLWPNTLYNYYKHNNMYTKVQRSIFVNSSHDLVSHDFKIIFTYYPSSWSLYTCNVGTNILSELSSHVCYKCRPKQMTERISDQPKSNFDWILTQASPSKLLSTKFIISFERPAFLDFWPDWGLGLFGFIAAAHSKNHLSHHIDHEERNRFPHSQIWTLQH